jgi:hypothetical protein
MNKNIQNSIEKVSNSFPSLFSREDVIKLLTDLNTEIENESPKSSINHELLLNVFRDILCDKNWEDVVDKNDIELGLSYHHQIEIESVPVNEDFLINEAVNALEAALEAIPDIIDETPNLEN